MEEQNRKRKGRQSKLESRLEAMDEMRDVKKASLNTDT